MDPALAVSAALTRIAAVDVPTMDAGQAALALYATLLTSIQLAARDFPPNLCVALCSLLILVAIESAVESVGRAVQKVAAALTTATHAAIAVSE